MREVKCDDCKYFLGFVVEGGKPLPVGDCHRFPPIPYYCKKEVFLKQVDFSQIKTSRSNCCGEYCKGDFIGPC